MERVNLQKMVSTYPLLDEQAWALCFKSVKSIQTMHGSFNNSCVCESVFSNLALGSVELTEEGEISLDLTRNNSAAEKKCEAAAKINILPPGSPACMKGTGGSKSTFMGCTESPLSATRGDSSVVDNTGTTDVASPPIQLRSKFDRLRHEVQVKQEEEKEPEIVNAEAVVVLALGRIIRQAMKSTPEGDKDQKLYDLLARMTGVLSKRPSLLRISNECETHGKWDGDFRYTCILRDCVCFYQMGGVKSDNVLISTKEPGVDQGEVDDNNKVSDDSSDDSEESESSDDDSLSTQSSELSVEELGSTLSELQDTKKSQNDIIMTNRLGARDADEKNIPTETVDITSEVRNISEEAQHDGDNGILSQEEPPKDQSDDLCGNKSENETNPVGELVQPQIDAEASNIPPETVEIKSEVINPVKIEKDEGDDNNIILSQEEPSKKKGKDLFGENTPQMQDTLIADTKSDNMAAKSTGYEDGPQKVKQENLKQQKSADKPSLIVKWGDVPEAWCANLTVQQMKAKMGIDQDKVNVPKRNWTRTTSKAKIENTKVEPTTPVPVSNTANGENKIVINQAEEKADAGPMDEISSSPISVNWGDVAEPWSAKLTVHLVKAKMGIKEKSVVRPKKIINKKKVTIVGASTVSCEDLDSLGVNSEQQSQEDSAPSTINWGNVPERWGAKLTVQQVKTKMGIKEKTVVGLRRKSLKTKEPEDLQGDKCIQHQEEKGQEKKTVNPPITVKWGNEPEQWAAQLKVAEIKNKMGIKEENMVRPRKNWDKKTVNPPVTVKKGNELEQNSLDRKAAEMQDEKTVIPPITVKWGNEAEQWAAQLNLKQIKEKMGIKEEKVITSRNNLDRDSSTDLQAINENGKTVQKGSDCGKQEVVEMETTTTNEDKEVKDSDMDEGLNSTAKAADETAKVNDSEKVEKMETDITTSTGSESDETEDSNRDEPVEVDTNATTRQGFETVKDSIVKVAAELATAMPSGEDIQQVKSCDSVKPGMLPTDSNRPSRGARLSKTQLDEIKAHLLKPSVPKPVSRKVKTAVHKISPLQPRTESELLLQLSASNQPKEAGFLKSMLNKAGTYLNPFQWTKAKAEPAIDSSLDAEAIQSDLTSKKGWLPPGVSKVLLPALDASVYAALGYCGFYQVLSAERLFHLLLIYSNLTSKPTMQKFAIVTSASQAVGFYFSPIGKRYLYPK